MQSSKKQTAIGFVLIVLLAFLVFLLLHWLWRNLSRELLVTLVVAVITVVGSVWTARSTKLKDRELQIQAQQAERREAVCTKFMSDLWCVTQDPEKATDKEFVSEMMKSVMVGGLLWWGDQTVKSYVDFRRVAVKDSQKILRAAAGVILSMRADLGHKNDGLTEKDVLDVFLQGTEELFKES